jgi:PTS system cellobiose-specific IIC component
MGFMDKLSSGIDVVAEKVEGNKYLRAIKDAFTAYMPFIIIGSFALLFNVLLTSPTTGLAQFAPFSFLTALAPAFSTINFATMDIMSLLIPLFLASNLAKSNNTNPLITSAVALIAYVIVVPQFFTTTVDGVQQVVKGLPATSTNASGLFIGMILTILVVELFTKLSNVNALRIKMPPSVPGGIVASFNVLLPIFVTLIIVALAAQLFLNTTGMYMNEFIYKIVQAPLERLVQSPGGIMLLVIVSQIFWLVGIHGGLIISPIRNPLLIAALANNIAAVQAGEPATNPVTMGFWMSFIVPGGAGLTLSLLIAILIASKRDDHKAVAKVSFMPGLFGISEPVVFGLPLVLNPVFAIPFVFASSIGTAIALFFNQIGFLQPNTVDVPFGLPLGVGAFLGYGINGVIVQMLIMALGVVMYMPFVLAANKATVAAEETETENESQIATEKI